MRIDAQFDVWRRQWQAGKEEPAPGLAADLEARVARESRLMRWGMIFPILVSAVIGGGVIVRALGTGRSEDAILAVEAWLFILAMWAGCLWIARGTWRPYAETTAAFVDLSIRRCRANLRTFPFATALYVFQLVTIVVLKLEYSSADLGAVLTATPTLLLGGVGLPAMLAAGFWYSRRQRAELERLLDLERQLTEE